MQQRVSEASCCIYSCELILLVLVLLPSLAAVLFFIDLPIYLSTHKIRFLFFFFFFNIIAPFWGAPLRGRIISGEAIYIVHYTYLLHYALNGRAERCLVQRNMYVFWPGRRTGKRGRGSVMSKQSVFINYLYK